MSTRIPTSQLVLHRNLKFSFEIDYDLDTMILFILAWVSDPG